MRKLILAALCLIAISIPSYADSIIAGTFPPGASGGGGAATLPLPGGATNYVQINPTSQQAGAFNVQGGTTTVLIVNSTSSVSDLELHVSHLPINGGAGPQIASPIFYGYENVNSGSTGSTFIVASTEPYSEGAAGAPKVSGAYLQLNPANGGTAPFINFFFTNTSGLFPSASFSFNSSAFTASAPIKASGGFYFPTENSQNANYTTVSTDTVILASATPSGMTITLSSTSLSAGQNLIITKVDASTQIVTINATGAGGADTINYGTNTVTLNALGQTVELVSDGVSSWISNNSDFTPAFVGDGILPVGSTSVGTSSNTFMQSMTVASHVSITGIRIQVQVQLGTMDLGVYDRTGRLLGHTGSVAVPSGTATTNLITPVNLAPGYYYLGLLCNNTTAQFGRVSQGNIVGSIVFTGTATTLANQTISGGSANNNRFAMVGIVSGGITQ